jgi:hypothetical protein
VDSLSQIDYQKMPVCSSLQVLSRQLTLLGITVLVIEAGPL